jgi:hypothetical protein
VFDNKAETESGITKGFLDKKIKFMKKCVYSPLGIDIIMEKI